MHTSNISAGLLECCFVVVAVQEPGTGTMRTMFCTSRLSQFSPYQNPLEGSYLVDPSSSHMLVLDIKPGMPKVYKLALVLEKQYTQTNIILIFFQCGISKTVQLVKWRNVPLNFRDKNVSSRGGKSTGKVKSTTYTRHPYFRRNPYLGI